MSKEEKMAQALRKSKRDEEERRMSILKETNRKEQAIYEKMVEKERQYALDKLKSNAEKLELQKTAKRISRANQCQQIKILRKIELDNQRSSNLRDEKLRLMQEKR